MHHLTHMKLLVTLAQADGKVAEREKKYIFNIAAAHGVPSSDIQPLFEKQHAVVVPNGLTAEEKFDCLYSLVQLMKIDERMYQEEIRFCSSIAARLGYEQEVMFELMLQVKGNSPDQQQIQELKKITDKYLKSN